MSARRDAALLGEQDVIRAAGRAGIHGVDDDAGLAQRLPQSRPHRLHALAAAEQQDLDAAMLDHRAQALGGDIGERRHRPILGSVGEHQDRAIVAAPADVETARAIAVDDLAAGGDERRDVHGS